MASLIWRYNSSKREAKSQNNSFYLTPNHMIKSENIPHYLVGILLFIILKFGFTYADNDSLRFLTKPTSSVISTIKDSDAVYSSAQGFYHEKLYMVIDKSCSGFNFWMLAFIMTLFTTLRYTKSSGAKIWLFPTAMVGTYLLTIIINSSRIMTSLLLNDIIGNKYAWLHQAEGAFIYLTFLITFYVILNYLLQKFYQIDAKLA